MGKHNIRRELLEVILRQVAPATIEDVCRDAGISIRLEQGLSSKGDIATELAGLALHGYLQNMRPGRAPLYRITATGADQINRDADLDEYVWGEYASKFAGGA